MAAVLRCAACDGCSACGDLLAPLTWWLWFVHEWRPLSQSVTLHPCCKHPWLTAASTPGSLLQAPLAHCCKHPWLTAASKTFAHTHTLSRPSCLLGLESTSCMAGVRPQLTSHWPSDLAC